MINKIIEVQKALAKKQREWSERQREWFESFKSRDKVNIDDYINALEEGAMVLTGLDNCVLGIDQNGYLVYDYEKIVNHFMVDDNMTLDDAVEYVDFNVLGLNGNFTVVFAYKETNVN